MCIHTRRDPPRTQSLDIVSSPFDRDCTERSTKLEISVSHLDLFYIPLLHLYFATMPSRNLLRRAPKTIRLAVAEYQALKNPVLPFHEQPESADAALLAKLEPTANEARPAQDEIYGWIRSIRAHKNVSFAEIDDGTARIQSVLKGKGRADG